MDVRGEYTFKADRFRVWDALTDPESLAKSLPGCQEFRETSPENYRVTMKVNVIAFDVTVSGDVAITERNRPNSHKVIVTGNGSAGTLRVEVALALSGKDAGSLLKYHLAIQTTGPLSMLGFAVLDPAVKMIMNQFMGKLDEDLSAAQAQDPAPATSKSP